VAGSRAEDLAVGAVAHFEGLLRNPRASTASTTAGLPVHLDSALYAALKRRSLRVSIKEKGRELIVAFFFSSSFLPVHELLLFAARDVAAPQNITRIH
jgi:hypothetical protein